jgi:hypothetical protein
MQIGDVPVLLGDIATSTKVGQALADVPTGVEVSQIFPPECDRTVSGLRQKLAVIGGNLALGCAGPMDPIAAMIGELSQCNSADPLTPHQVHEYFRNRKWTGEEPGYFAGFVKAPTGFEYFSYNSAGQGVDFHTQCYGTAALLGSGAIDAKRYLLESSFGVIEGGTSAAQRAVAAALAMAGNFLAIESASGDTLRRLYGAGYEVATLINGRFQKLDNVTYLLWFGELKDRNIRVWSTPIWMTKYAYVDDFLLVRVARREEPGTNECGMRVDESVYIVPPLHKERFEFPKQQPEFQLPMHSAWICSCFVLQASGGQTAHHAFVSSGAVENPQVLIRERQISDQQSEVTISFQPAVLPKWLEFMLQAWMSS